MRSLRWASLLWALVVVLFIVVLADISTFAEGGGSRILRASVNSDGEQGDFVSYHASISGDGRWVAFTSLSTTFSEVDSNYLDIFVHDLGSEKTHLISVASDGTPGNANSQRPALSTDGQVIGFASEASNLVAGDTNQLTDIFVRNVATGITERVSVSASGAEATGGHSTVPAMSGDGRFVVFLSTADNLVSGDSNFFCDNDVNGTFTENCADVFVRDRVRGTTTRVSVSSSGEQGLLESFHPDISADGRYVTFTTASALVADDLNGTYDVYVYDLLNGTTVRASVDSAGGEANNYSTRSRLSANGQYVAFLSVAGNLVSGDTNQVGDVFVRDIVNQTTERISLSSGGVQGNDGVTDVDISADGRYVVFRSFASTMVYGDNNYFCGLVDIEPGTENCSDVFLHDRQSGRTVLLSLSDTGDPANTYGPLNFYDSVAIADSGTTIAFDSRANTLVADDSNFCDVNFDGQIDRIESCTDVFVRVGVEGLPSSGIAYIPLLQRGQTAPPPVTPTPTITPSPTPVCQALDVEPNDSRANANGLPPLCQNSQVQGTLWLEEDETHEYDLYRIELTQTVEIEMVISGLPEGGDYRLLAYPPDSSTPALDGQPFTGGGDTVQGMLPPGRYYVSVLGSELVGTSDPYQLRWRILPDTLSLPRRE